MNKSEDDVFYDINQLPKKTIIELLKEAKKMSYKLMINKLDTSESFARQNVDISFEELLKRIDDKTHFVFIHRRGFRTSEYHLEIGFRTMEAIDHFLFIEVDENKKQYFLEKYQLQTM